MIRVLFWLIVLVATGIVLGPGYALLFAVFFTLGGIVAVIKAKHSGG
jgi:hypothetical protein